ncbi:MAG: CHAT domain-containing protein [Planctomycetota bacterium]
MRSTQPSLPRLGAALLAAAPLLAAGACGSAARDEPLAGAPELDARVQAQLVADGFRRGGAGVVEASDRAPELCALQLELLAVEDPRTRRALSPPPAAAALDAGSLLPQLQAARRHDRDGRVDEAATAYAELSEACAASDLERLGAWFGARAADRLATLHRPHDMLAAAEALVARAGDAPLARAFALSRRGVARHSLRLPGAHEDLRAALALARRWPDSELRVYTAEHLGWAEFCAYEHAQAERFFEEAEDAARRRDDWARVARMLGCRAANRTSLGDYAAADRLAERAVELAARHGSAEQVAFLQLNRVHSLESRGALGAARDALAAAEAAAGAKLTSDANLRVRWLSARAHVERDSTGRLPEALAAEASAAFDELGPILGKRLSPLLLEHELALGRHDEALARTSPALEPSGDGAPGLAHQRLVAARALTLLGRPHAALDAFLGALRLTDSQRAPLADVDAWLRFKQSSKAWNVATHALAPLAELYEREPSAELALQALALIEHERARTLREVSLGAEGHGGIDPAALGERARTALRPDEVFVALNVEAAIAVALRGGEARLWRLPPRAELERDFDFAAAHFAGAPLEDARRFAEHGARLYSALLGPLEDGWLADARRLVVVDDGPLCAFPLDLLPRRAAPAAGFGALPLVFRSLEVEHVPCLEALLRRGAAPPVDRPRRVLALSFESQALPALPHAGAELSAVRGAFAAPHAATVRSGGESAAWIGRELPDYDALHLIGHLRPDRTAGERSGMRLAHAAWTAADVLALNAPLELVVVSACAGGGGEAVDAEGVVGFGWGWLGAGSRHLLASPLPVEDGAASKLFGPFYRAWLSGQDPPAALRSARLGLAADGSHEGERAMLQPFIAVRGLR